MIFWINLHYLWVGSLCGDDETMVDSDEEKAIMKDIRAEITAQVSLGIVYYTQYINFTIKLLCPMPVFQ